MLRFLLVLAFIVSPLFCDCAALAQSTEVSSEPVSAKRNDESAIENDSANSSKSIPPSDVVADTDSQARNKDGSRLKSARGKDRSLPNLIALMNIIANGIEILCLAWGLPACLLVPVGLVLVWIKGKRWWGAAMILFGPIVVIVGLAAPGVINILMQALVDTAILD
jgi:hypothetical protein